MAVNEKKCRNREVENTIVDAVSHSAGKSALISTSRSRACCSVVLVSSIACAFRRNTESKMGSDFDGRIGGIVRLIGAVLCCPIVNEKGGEVTTCCCCWSNSWWMLAGRIQWSAVAVQPSGNSSTPAAGSVRVSSCC